MTATLPKIVWRVDPRATGRFAWSQKRGWPTAYYAVADGMVCAHIFCKDEYHPRRVTVGDHGPLSVRVADHSQNPWQWRTLKKKFNRIEAAKAGVEEFLRLYPSFVPKEFKS